MNEDSMPLVSIVAPMYNVEKYIDTFIQCILDQTYKNWELILVDDGSTDNTLSVVHNFSDSRIQVYIRDKYRNKGANACRNIGMEKSNGKYLIIVDSDDIVERKCLEQRVIYMENNDDIDYATARGSTIAERSDGTLELTNKVWGRPSNNDILMRLLSTKYPFGVWNNIYRIERFKDCQWDEALQIYQDFDFMVTTALKEKRHDYITDSEVDYLYREGRPNSITANYISKAKYISTNYLFDKVQRSLKGMPNANQLKRQFYNFYIIQMERLLTNGSEEQYREFYEKLLNDFKEYLNLRVIILNYFFGHTVKEEMLDNSTKWVLLAHLIMFDRRRLFAITKNKLLKK